MGLAMVFSRAITNEFSDYDTIPKHKYLVTVKYEQWITFFLHHQVFFFFFLI